MNLDETIKYYVEKAEMCEELEIQWREKATEYRQTANYLIELREMQEDKTSHLEKFLNRFAPTKLRGDDNEA